MSDQVWYARETQGAEPLGPFATQREARLAVSTHRPHCGAYRDPANGVCNCDKPSKPMSFVWSVGSPPQPKTVPPPAPPVRVKPPPKAVAKPKPPAKPARKTAPKPKAKPKGKGR